MSTPSNNNFHGSNGALKGVPPIQGGGAPALFGKILGTPIHQRGPVIWWESGLDIDADGSPHAYNPNSKLGLDRLANAGGPGNWYGILTNNGEPDGKPLTQRSFDPAPGFYISTTALQDFSRAVDDPLRYVDAGLIPYLVLPSILKSALNLGDFALVVNRCNGKRVGAIFADTWDNGRLGEGSIALANALGVPSDPRTGGASSGIMVIAFPASATRPTWPHSITEINARVAGFVTQYQADLPNLPAV